MDVAGSGMGSQEKDVWLLILDNKLDDIAIAIGPKTRERMENFAEKLFRAISVTARKLQAVAEDAHARELRKTDLVAELTAKLAKQREEKLARGQSLEPHHEDELISDLSLYYAVFDGKNPEKVIINKIKVPSFFLVRILSGSFTYTLRSCSQHAPTVTSWKKLGTSLVDSNSISRQRWLYYWGRNKKYCHQSPGVLAPK